MAYVITGATGHIGNNVARKLVENGKDVVLLVRKIDDSIKNISAKKVVGSVFTEEFLNENIKKGDVVIHIAGVIDIKNKNKEQTYNVNYLATKLILDIAIKNQASRFIYFSSVDAIINDGSKIVEPSYMEPNLHKDYYGYTKALATQYVMKKRLDNINTIINILYPSAVIGPNDYKPSLIGKVVNDVIKGKMQFGIKGGYDFIDVEDIALCVNNLIDKNKKGDYLLVGEVVSVYELYDYTNKSLGRNKKTIKIPTILVYPFIFFIPYLSRFALKTLQSNPQYDNSRMINDLGVKPRPFDETINNTVKFFKEYYHEKTN